MVKFTLYVDTKKIWVTYINKYFNKISKKRDLSCESNPEENRRKAREGSSTTSINDAAKDEVFQQVSTTNDISEVLEHLKTLEVQISERYSLNNDTRSVTQSLADVTQSLKLILEKFNEFEKDHKEEEKIINSLKKLMVYRKGLNR